MATVEKGFQQFQEYTAAQGVFVHPFIEQAAAIGASFGNAGCPNSVVYEPTPLYAAVAQAGKLLRERPKIALADKPLDVPSDAIPHQDIALRTLIDLVNGSLDRTASDVPSYRSTACQTMPATHACDQAEAYFAGVFWQMANHDELLSEEKLDEPFGYQIITDDTERAVGIRKGISWPTLLTLERIAINGVVYPPGSIMRADMPFEQSWDSSYHPMTDFSGQERIEFGDIARLGFMRLSAFVLPSGQRSTVFNKATRLPKNSWAQYGFNASIKDILVNWSLERIKEQAAQTVQKIGGPVAVM